MEERRLRERIRCSADVVELRPAGAIAGRATNLSEGGLYLQRQEGEPMAPGEALCLEIALPDGKIRAFAEVVQPGTEVFYPSASVRFTAVPPEDHRRLARFVAGLHRGPDRRALPRLRFGGVRPGA